MIESLLHMSGVGLVLYLVFCHEIRDILYLFWKNTKIWDYFKILELR